MFHIETFIWLGWLEIEYSETLWDGNMMICMLLCWLQRGWSGFCWTHFSFMLWLIGNCIYIGMDFVIGCGAIALNWMELNCLESSKFWPEAAEICFSFILCFCIELGMIRYSCPSAGFLQIYLESWVQIALSCKTIKWVLYDWWFGTLYWFMVNLIDYFWTLFFYIKE